MKEIIRKNLHITGSGKFCFLALICLVFSLSNRMNAALTYEQYCLSVLTDHYYLIYFMIPLFLFLCLAFVEDDTEIVIIRFGGYTRYFFAKFVSILVITFLFMAIQLSVILLSGIGLPLGNSWTLEVNTLQAELFHVLAAYFTTPILAFYATAFHMFLGLCVIGLLSMWIVHFLSKTVATKLLMAIYLLTACSIKIPFLQQLPLTGFNHWVILHHNLTSKSRYILTVVTTIILISLISWTVKKYWRVRPSFHNQRMKGITPYYCRKLLSRKNLLIMIAVSVLMFLWKHMRSIDVQLTSDYVIGMFAGHGIGDTYILGLLEMLVDIGLPLYLLANFIEDVAGNHSLFITIRLHRRYTLLSGILKSSLILIGIYGLILTLLPFIGLYTLGLPWSGETIALLLNCIGLKLLDIWMQFLLMMVIYCLTRQITIGFITLIGLNLLCVIPSRIISYLPFGLSSISRLHLPQTQNGITIYLAYLILGLTNMIFFLWLHFVGQKKLLTN